MSGTGHTVAYGTASGDPRIDGLQSSYHWGDSTISYYMPSTDEYSGLYGKGEDVGIYQLSAAMQTAVHTILNADTGSVANDGFSVEGFTNLNIVYGEEGPSHIRVAQTTLDPYNYKTAWGYYPSGGSASGDVWLTDVSYDYSNPVVGTYAYTTMIHEIGHALGLIHPHSGGAFGTVPAQYDSMEYTIMSYKSYAYASNGYSNSSHSYAQTYMMQDIAALQHMYGADFTTNSGDTVYSWSSSAGITYVDGAAGITPGSNTIFATIWDGGGIDTYDLSAYTTDLVIDLTPGGHSTFDTSQLAGLSSSVDAQGNIYNALQYQNDTRSLIENATGGTGRDKISGNQVDNVLNGGKGNDNISGFSGKDTLVGGNGRDVLKGGTHNDTLIGNYGYDKLYGDSGKDILFGGKGNDKLTGGWGKDTMTGGAGADTFRFVKVTDSRLGDASDVITDFTSGVDKIHLGALSSTLFTFDSKDFSGTGPSVTTDQNGAKLIVKVDIDGDSTADMWIVLSNVTSVTADDFIL